MAFLDDAFEDQIENFSEHYVDESVKENADFQYETGMKPKVIRISSGHCCAWCADIAGEYDYPNVPDDVYHRHSNCDCSVDYLPGDGRRQDVWTKEWRNNSKQISLPEQSGTYSIDSNGYYRSPFKHAHFKTGGLTPQEYALKKAGKDVAKYDRSGIIKMPVEDFKKTSFESIHHLKYSLENYDVRLWYDSHVDMIGDLIDKSKTLREQARQACNLRNQFRTEARDLMIDQKYRKEVLEVYRKNKTFEQLVEKNELKGFTGDDVYRNIIASSMRHSKEFDVMAGL